MPTTTRIAPPEHPPTKAEARALLADTAHAVKVMKASWLHVALNLRRIREHEVWRHCEPPCSGYDQYVLDVLKINRHVANRMLEAMSYTAERRPEILRQFEAGADEGPSVPSYEVVNRLRRIQSLFEEQDEQDDFRDLESRVFDERLSREGLSREIAERRRRWEAGGEPDGGSPKEESGDDGPATIAEVLDVAKRIERRLASLKAPKEIQELAFRLVEALQKEV
ncbi:MAG: hypothetical protein HY719_07575 [Planctomycetes bacterium]|nr:hypothetical protein [Planctomycetota bacterium]